MTDFGSVPSLLRAIRAALDLTQAELAATLDVSFATVNRWEGGGNKPQKAKLAKILALAAEAGVDPDEADLDGVPQVPRRRTQGQAGATAATRSMEQMLWNAACSIRGEKDAPKFKDYLLPLLFLKRLSDVFDDEIARLAEDFGSGELALEIAEDDHSLLRFYLPPEARWSVISGRSQYEWPVDDRGRTTTPKDVGEHLTRAVRAVVRHNPRLSGVIDVVDFAAERNGERDVNPAKLRGVVETFSDPRYRLGLADVQPDFLGRAYEYLLRKFAEGSGQSAGEYFTPTEVGFLMARIMRPKPGETCHDYACGSGGLLIKLQLVARELDPTSKVPLRMYGQELQAESFAVAEMNTIIHDMDVVLQRGDTMINPKFRDAAGALMKYDIVVANPMWNQSIDPAIYGDDPFDRFTGSGGVTSGKADWAWLQHTLATMNDRGRAAVVLDTGAVARGSGSKSEDKERNIRKWFVDRDLIEGVVSLPENLFYNTTAAGLILVLSRRKSESRKGKIVLLNASQRFTKGRPKNYLTPKDVSELSTMFLRGEPVAGEVAVVTTDDIGEADYNLSPSRWVHRIDDATERPIDEVVKDLAIVENDAVGVHASFESLLDKLLVDRTRIDQAETEIGPIPSHWTVAPLTELCSMKSGGTPPKSDASHWMGDVPWVSGKDLKRKRLEDSTDHITTEAAAAFSSIAPEESVLCLVRGMGLAKGFPLSLITRPMAFNQDIKALIPNERVTGAYLMHALSFAAPRMLRNVANAAHGTKRLSQADLDRFVLPVPPFDEQREIARILDVVNQEIEVLARRHELVHDLSAALLSNLIVGEVGPQHLTPDDADLTPAGTAREVQ